VEGAADSVAGVTDAGAEFSVLMQYLELKATFARSVGELFNFAVIGRATSVEDDGGDAGGFGLGRESGAKRFGAGEISLELLLAQLGIEAGKENQRGAGVVVDRLRVNVLGGEANSKTRARRGSVHLLANAPPAVLQEACFGNSVHF
jgi:hypothetical protein